MVGWLVVATIAYGSQEGSWQLVVVMVVAVVVVVVVVEVEKSTHTNTDSIRDWRGKENQKEKNRKKKRKKQYDQEIVEYVSIWSNAKICSENTLFRLFSLA